MIPCKNSRKNINRPQILLPQIYFQHILTGLKIGCCIFLFVSAHFLLPIYEIVFSTHYCCVLVAQQVVFLVERFFHPPDPRLCWLGLLSVRQVSFCAVNETQPQATFFLSLARSLAHKTHPLTTHIIKHARSKKYSQQRNSQKYVYSVYDEDTDAKSLCS